MDSFLVTCEHGGNLVPPPYRHLFADRKALLATHRGYDPGALEMARQLAEAFAAELFSSTVTRLLVDLNRSIGHPHLFSNATEGEPKSLRREIVALHYEPYRSDVELFVEKAVERGHRVVHISSHSFTPVLDGQVRDVDVGLLYDPARRVEAELCARWKDELSARAPDLRIRRNHPYRGNSDGLTSHLRKRFGPDAYLGVELEVNQETVFGPAPRWKALRGRIVDSLRAATAN